MKKNILKFVLWLMMILITNPLWAGPDDPPTDDDPVDPAPIDNWILLLILAGIAIGIYYKFNTQKSKAPGVGEIKR